MFEDLPKEESPKTSSQVSDDAAGHAGKVALSGRAVLLDQQPRTIWLTGLSGSGKSTLAFEVKRRLLLQRRPAFVMDGDEIRRGLSRDLGFSPQDRHENIRRVAEVARLFNDAGLIVITSFISPYRQDREIAREIIGRDRFIETHLCAGIDVCEKRDPKGLYKKAREGLIAEFTGVTAPYEAPEHAELVIDTGRSTIDDCVLRILQSLA
jgi:adenylyl-sulfate kinase